MASWPAGTAGTVGDAAGVPTTRSNIQSVFDPPSRSLPRGWTVRTSIRGLVLAGETVTASAASERHRVDPVLFWVGTTAVPGAIDRFMPPATVVAIPVDAPAGHSAPISARSIEPAKDPACSHRGANRVMAGYLLASAASWR